MRSPVLFLMLCCAAAMAQPQPASTSNPSGKPATANSQAAASPTAGETPAPPKPAVETPAPQKPDSDAMPTTVILDKSAPGARSTTTDGSDPLFEPPALPKGSVSLIGGVVRSIDRVKNRINVQPFNGKSMSVRFDERTHIYRDGVETTQLGIRKGDRIYVDTMLDRSFVLARNVHVVTELQPADARGQLVQFNDRTNTMVVQDDLSRQPVRFHVDGTTQIKKAGAAGSMSDLAPGALIAVRFAPDRGNRGVAREVTIYATPGATYTFAGEITHLNLATGTLAIHNLSDDKSYAIEFDPVMSSGNLQLGAQATIQAQFTGRNYKAAQIQVTQAAVKEQ
jgi:hypothetical protein